MWALEGKGCQRYCGFQQSRVGTFWSSQASWRLRPLGLELPTLLCVASGTWGYGLGSTMVKKQGKRWTDSGYICEKGRVVVGSEQET